MAACVARNLLSTACRVLAQSRVSRPHIQRRAFSYSKFLSATRLYTEKHEWVLIEGGKGTVGISDYAQESLGDIVYVDLPELGTVVQPGDVAGCVESVKAASDLYSPIGGTVAEINRELESSPELVNKSPLDKGWLYKLDVEEGTDTSNLMDDAAYEKFLEAEN